jgi:hypothetical protein
MHFRKVAFSAVMLAAGLYILLPTADEVIVHPTLGFLLASIFNIPYIFGVLISIVLYRAIGVICLVSAIATGGKPIYLALKQKLKKKPL